MKALILAAGFGSRLIPLTNTLPKSLVKVNGTPILFKQINNLHENGITDITVVTGYLSNIMKETLSDNYSEVNIIENKHYNTTNNMYSAYLAGELFDDDLLMMNADVFYESSVITDLLGCPYDNSIAVDRGRFLEESMKITFDGHRIDNISKEINIKDAYGTSIDVYKFSRDGAKCFFNSCKYYIEIKKELKLWSEVALAKALTDEIFMPCDIRGKWVEIDNHDDLKIAEELF